MKKIPLYSLLLLLTISLVTVCQLFAQKQGQEKVDSMVSRLNHHYRTDTAKVNLLNDIAWEFQSINPQKGIEYAGTARKIAEELNYSLGLGESYLSTGVCNYAQSDDKKALENYNQALKILTGSRNNGTMATVYLNIGNIYFNKQEFPKTLECYDKALALLKEVGDNRRSASVYGNIGNVYYAQCNYDKALEYHQKAYQLAVKSGNLKVQGNSLMGIGNIYTRLPDYPKALEYFYRALRVFENAGNKKSTASAYGGIGIVYYRQQQSALSLENFYKARKIAEEIGDKRGCATTYTNIGNVYIQEKDFNKALDSHLKAYELFEQIGYGIGMASALGNIGQVYTELHNYDRALYYYQQAYAENIKLDNKSSEIYNLKGIGSLYLSMVKDTVHISKEKREEIKLNKQAYLVNAIKFSSLAIALGKEINELEPMIEAYTVISRTYQLRNEWEKAFFYRDSAQVLRDSVYSKENQIRISEIGAKQAAELKEKEIEIIALQVKHQRIAITTISACLVLMIVILFMIYRSLQIKKKNNQWLEEEVKKRTLELQQSNKMLEKANQGLLRLEEAKAEFLKLISHEIRTPLNGIIGFTDLLKEELHTPEFAIIVKNIDKSVKRLERFSIAALLITELKNKNVTINYSELSLMQLVNNTIEQTQANSLQKGLKFRFLGEIEQLHVKGDPELLRICMETLFDNAVKYSADGGEISVNAVMENQKVIFEIKDEGRGFSNESIEKIFSLFATGEGHLDNNTGLSLALVKMIMDAHGGHIDVGNNEDKGAFVKLSFAV